MKIVIFVTGLFILTACEPTKKVVDVPPPAPSVAPVAPALNVPEPRFQMRNIIGLEKDTVENIMGQPSLKRIEKEAEVWLYDNQFCNAHVYFYEDDNSEMHAEYIESSEEKDLVKLTGQRADFCISTFLQD